MNNPIAMVERAVFDSLQQAEVIALVPNPRDNIEREGYEERSYIVVWTRPVRLGQPSLDDDGMTYATHRVHINSNGDSACFDGRYDQSRIGALHDMLERARIDLLPNVDAAVLAAQAMPGVHHVHLRRSGANCIVGIVGDDVLGMELDVRQISHDAWYVSDDDGKKHHGHSIVDAINEARSAHATHG